MQSAEQADQHRLAAEIIDGDLAVARDRIEHNIGCPFADLQLAIVNPV